VFDNPTKIEKTFDPYEESWNKVRFPFPGGGGVCLFVASANMVSLLRTQQFSNVPTGDAWQCTGCQLWNKAFAKHYCAFCKSAK
jgi:hypothetical protein